MSTKYFQNKNKKSRKKYFKKQQQTEVGKETKNTSIKNKEMNMKTNDLNQMEDIVEEDSSSENDMGVLESKKPKFITKNSCLVKTTRLSNFFLVL